MEKDEPKGLTWKEILLAAAMAIFLSLNAGCSPKEQIRIIEDWTYILPRGTVDQTMARGWKGEI